MRKSKRSYRKNPYGVPFLIPVAIGLIGGGIVVGTTGAVMVGGTQAKENKKNRDVEKVRRELGDDYADLDAGNDISDFNRPATLTLPPTSEKVAWLQAAVAYRDAAQKVKDKGGDNSDLVSKMGTALNTADNQPDDTSISPDDSRLKTPLQEAGTEIAKYGSDMTGIVARSISNQDSALIGEIQADIAAMSPSKQVKDAMVKTASDVTMPFQIAGGLISGKKPFGMDQKTWNIIRFSLYGVIGLGTFAYVKGLVDPLLSVLPDKDEE